MKKIYCVPVMQLEAACESSVICDSLVRGGNAAVNNITEADANNRFDLWKNEGDSNEEWGCDQDNSWDESIW